MTAQRPLRFRMLLTMVYIPLFAAGAVLFAVWALWSDAGDSPSPGILMALSFICALLALLALGEAVAIQHRRERARRRQEEAAEGAEPNAPEEPGPPGPPSSRGRRPDDQGHHGPEHGRE